MTWVVGAASMLGYAVGLSDVCVTFKSSQGDTVKDCLQKIYPVSRFFAVGFAGSVTIGFAMLDALCRWLGPIPDDTAWLPGELAELFPNVAKVIFAAAPKAERDAQSHLMIIAAHPTEDTLPGHAKCSAYIFRSPDFVPETATPGQVVSIGKGGAVGVYKEVLASFSADPLSLLRGEEMNQKLGSLALEHSITNAVRRQPTTGVSVHFHVCVVRRGEIQLHPNDENTYTPDGRIIEFRMPPVAGSLSEFRSMAAAHGLSAEGAIC
jgi:hypothetical protein